MKIVKILLVIIAILFAVVLITGALLPKNYKVARSIVINAEKTEIWEILSKFKNNNKFSPWYEKDTTAKYTFNGVDGEVGCTFEWNGNKEVGSGIQTRKSQKENEEIVNTLKFLKPWESEAISRFLLKDTSGATQVTWTLEGEAGLFARTFMFFMGGMDKAIGADYEKGLKKLKEVCESGPIANSGIQVAEADLPPMIMACVMKSTTIDAAKKMAPEEYGKAAEAIMKHISAKGAKPVGNMHAIYFTWDEKANKTDWAICFPVDKEFASGEGVEMKKIEGGKAVWATHIGPYEKLAEVHNTVMQHALKKGTPGVVMEEYVVSPSTEKDPNKYNTKIIYMIGKK